MSAFAYKPSLSTAPHQCFTAFVNTLRQPVSQGTPTEVGGGVKRGASQKGGEGGDEEGEKGRGRGGKGERKGGGGKGRRGGKGRGGKEEREEGGEEGRKGVRRASGEKREGKSWLSPIPGAFGFVSSKMKETP